VREALEAAKRYVHPAPAPVAGAARASTQSAQVSHPRWVAGAVWRHAARAASGAWRQTLLCIAVMLVLSLTGRLRRRPEAVSAQASAQALLPRVAALLKARLRALLPWGAGVQEVGR